MNSRVSGYKYSNYGSRVVCTCSARVSHLVREPEGVEDESADRLGGEHVHDTDHDNQQQPCETCNTHIRFVD
ncbi:hypothetical protein DPMN_076163 [Dreissena polymorpha]|uniref:Uncharacterized protein n=1 Tax=Dreissena polymorpha TaxID=45954 RepID=A0A9D3YLV3_DREPO|nr:hypothetical protein DPMN_076163 [Dreissena polymorpha]